MNKEKLRKNLIIAGYVVNVLIALIMLLSAYGGMVNPEVTALPAIFAMTFPMWLAISILTAMADFFFRKRLALIQGAAIVLSLGPILSYSPLNLSHAKLNEEEENRSFTLMSYNVFGLNDYQKPYSPKDSTQLRDEALKGIFNPTLSYILERDPDIACLQEFYLSLDPNFPVIAKPLYDSICKRYPHRISGSANGILSKYPIYPVKLVQPEDPTAFYLGAVAEIQKHRTLIISAHMQSIGLDKSDRALYTEITKGEGGSKAIAEAKNQILGKLSLAFRKRAEQAKSLRHQIDSLGVDNVIVAGDFNDIPGCYALRQLALDDFKNAFTMTGFGPIITYHANRFYFHIDHILYRGDMEATGFYCGDFARSDHYPIEATFLWSESAKTVDRNLKGIDLINRRRDADTTFTGHHK